MSVVTTSRTAPLRRWTAPAVRLAVAAALLAAAALVWLERTAYRGWEAWGAAALTQVSGGTQVLVSRDRASWFIGTDTPEVFGLTVTSECTSAMITLSLLSVTAVLVLASRIRLSTLTTAVTLAAGASSPSTSCASP
ncbi:exosortase/archaeosortase family protein [Nocardioides alcanivorans]|uniref:exosortase/archaeosortase family protein n=1 Tax=Nocardioides alcanivorans TaxID=2897352 RepID=UPI001F2536D3|nr:exosortase/archaeosortase family protein [Nocardioides alcanivorans]